MSETALLLVDLQEEMNTRIRAGRAVVYPDFGVQVAALVKNFRAQDKPIVHVFHHEDSNPDVPFRRDQPGGQPMACATPKQGEAIFWKPGSSGFVGTGLEAHLRQQGITNLVVAGGVAAFCIASTVRSAANLGFKTTLAEDALIAFPLPDRNGGDIAPELALEVTLATLAADFAAVKTTAEILS
ncbi:MAG: isochorismatase family protein [Pelagimonas sp.]|uniref:isochorismatase family protein n=1 Tax=Pelagimonas sp. TaxID=2073170 RepID=UPI003D6A0BD7